MKSNHYQRVTATAQIQLRIEMTTAEARDCGHLRHSNPFLHQGKGAMRVRLIVKTMQSARCRAQHPINRMEF